MSALDPATEAYIERALAEAPPLKPEQAAVIVRILGPKFQTARHAASPDAAVANDLIAA